MSSTWSFTTGNGGSAPPAVTLASPSNGSTGQSLTPALSWNASSGATSYNVYLGTGNPPSLAASNIATTNYTPGTALSAGTAYYWYIVALNGSGSSPNSPIWSFTTASSGGTSQWTTSGANIYFSGGNVGIGTANPSYLLSVKGTIGTEEVVVTNTGWSDYVFDPKYRLLPLKEVDAYIQANHHLPDIPSEADIKARGVSVGDIQAKLLAKIEELTLHMIQEEKENQELRERIARLEKAVSK